MSGTDMTVVLDAAFVANGVVAKSLFTAGAGILRLAEIVTSIGIILSLRTGRGDAKKSEPTTADLAYSGLARCA